MAMACQYKKSIIQQRKETINEKQRQNQNKTYAHVAQAAAKQVINETQQTPTLRIHTNTELKTAIVVIHAHIHNLISPGTYAAELNRNLKAQNLPTINAPNDPPSGNLFNLKITDLFSEDDRQSALQLQRQLIQTQVNLVEDLENQSRNKKQTVRPKQIPIPTQDIEIEKILPPHSQPNSRDSSKNRKPRDRYKQQQRSREHSTARTDS